MKAIFFQICFAIPDEYLYLHISFRAAGRYLKLNHRATSFPPSLHALIWDPLLTLRPLHLLHEVSFQVSITQQTSRGDLLTPSASARPLDTHF